MDDPNIKNQLREHAFAAVKKCIILNSNEWQHWNLLGVISASPGKVVKVISRFNKKRKMCNYLQHYHGNKTDGIKIWKATMLLKATYSH